MMKRTTHTNVLRTLAAMLLWALLTPTAHARPTPPPLEDPAHWATVTHAGNAPYAITYPGNERIVGRVDYEYRISKTEVTSREWLEFLVAYAPYAPEAERRSSSLTGHTVTWVSLPGGGTGYRIWPGVEDFAATTSWRNAARYCNWLHNGKANAAWAFQSGVFDTSTFATVGPNGQYTDQRTRSAGARFWLPSEDEWVKAAYYDPNKFGAEQPGYWMYPMTQDTAPVVGAPGVGQTNGGLAGSDYEVEVGSYSNARSPWGVLDLSGGGDEWLEDSVTAFDGPLPYARRTRGSFAGSPYGAQSDMLDTYGISSTPGFFQHSIRIASLVPAPSMWLGAPLAVVFLSRRRQKNAP
jgi:hypothetical protein